MAGWQNPESFALWLALVLIIVIVLVSIFVLFTRMYFVRILQEQQKLQEERIAHQKQLLRDSILVQERERTRIAADLHDDLISKLNVSLLTLNTTQNIEETTQLLQHSIVLARHISHDLHPPLLSETNLEQLLEGFISPVQKRFKVQFYSVVLDKKELSDNIRLQIFRIAQEVINNIIKHAEASHIHVQLRQANQYLALKISDDGKGFPKTQKRGLGLKNIEVRSQALGGKTRFNSVPGQGTSFIFYLPHQPN